MITNYILRDIANEWDWCIQEHRLPIIETRGVNPQIPNICDEIIKYVGSHKPNVVKGSTLYYLSINITSVFCEKIDLLEIDFSGNKDSEFRANEAYLDEDSQKLTNIDILLSFSKSIKEDEFKMELSHELMHAFDCYQILIKNQGAVPQKYLKTATKYLKNNSENYDVFIDNETTALLRNCMYVIYHDEISANIQALYTFILNNKKITRINYKQYIQKTAAYVSVNLIKSLLRRINTANNSKKEIFGTFYMKYHQRTVNDAKEGKKTRKDKETYWYKRFKSYLEYMLKYYENKMYKVIYYALEQAERLDETRIIKPLSHRLFEGNKGLLKRNIYQC